MNRRLKKEITNIFNKHNFNSDSNIKLGCVTDMTNLLYNWYVFGKIDLIYTKTKENKKENLLYKRINHYVNFLFCFVLDLDNALSNLNDLCEFTKAKGYLKETKDV